MNNLNKVEYIFWRLNYPVNIAGFRILCLAVLLYIPPHHAIADLEFFSTAKDATLMYDAPSIKSRKLFVVSAHLPVEVIVNVEGWVKVRDSSGSLAWVEKRALSQQRFVIVTASIADIHQAANEDSALIFQAQKHVVMEWLDSKIPGWIRVRHRDGQSGYVRASQVWGS